MVTFISFILTVLGCINWLLIGLLQYDFIAGLFGFQASIFSRIFYILFGIASVYMVIRVIVNKGTFKVFEKKKKKEKVAQNSPTPVPSNVEAGKEEAKPDFHPENLNSTPNKAPEQNNNGLFDEHIKKS